jgi:FMN phosphatase YigB (HAD superfamily)
MVGDRVDNDLEPARAHDWQTFAIGPDPAPCFSRNSNSFSNSIYAARFWII